jgi:mannose-6-phosphate isomerase-like protein (cupin superfamily)
MRGGPSGFIVACMTTRPLPGHHDYVLVEPNGGERLRFLGQSALRLKHDGTDGPDAPVFYEYVSEPGAVGPPQHVHHAHDETFYVVEGSYEFTLGRETVLMPAGAFLFLPRGTPHTFRNAGDDLGCIVGTFAPGRFANYFRELAEIIDATGAPPDRESWTALYARYDTTFFDEFLDEFLDQ